MGSRELPSFRPGSGVGPRQLLDVSRKLYSDQGGMSDYRTGPSFFLGGSDEMFFTGNPFGVVLDFMTP